MTETPSDAPESTEEAPRRRGRPKGLPRTGGRQKGTPNRLTTDAKLRIDRSGDPIGFLCKIVRGRPIKGEAPTLEMRLTAAAKLLDKIAPTLKSAEVSGPDGGAIDIADSRLAATDQLDIAMRIGFALTRAERSIDAGTTPGLPAPAEQPIEAEAHASEPEPAAAPDPPAPINLRRSKQPRPEPVPRPETEAWPQAANGYSTWR